MNLHLDPQEPPRPLWEDLFAQAGRTALVQSWAWGEAKVAEGWTVRRRLIRRDDGQVVALAQMLERRLGGLLRLGRLNRGPVLLDPGAGPAAMAVLLRSWRWYRRAVLLTAPELAVDDLAGLGLRRRPAPLWRSAWLDLSLPEADLRRRLKGKWRNQLVGAEKSGCVVTVETDLAWMMDRYGELMGQKGFAGTPPATIARLQRHAWRPDDVLVLRAQQDGEDAGGILLARHGDAATYLVGWNGPVGRKVNANNLLLWRACLELRDRGVRCFDLGGIDPDLTPGIAAFKRGMGGDEFVLPGEYVKF